MSNGSRIDRAYIFFSIEFERPRATICILLYSNRRNPLRFEAWRVKCREC